jgi:hypothetical protein
MAIAQSADGETSQGVIRLYHGTDLASANDLLQNGVSQSRAAAWNGSGEFWATSDRGRAELFALSHPDSPPAACFEFDLAEPVLTAMVRTSPPTVIRHGDGDYEFLPASFAVLNQNMANRQVTPVP